MIREAGRLLAALRDIHAAVRDDVLAACAAQSVEELATVVAEDGGDLVFAIDRVSERTLLHHFATLARTWSCVLIAEGLGADGTVVLPEGTAADDAELRIIVDPIDGTRGLMYQKRAAWILTGVAPNRGPATTLADIELAVQTEIPTLKQHLCDSLWAVDGQCAGERCNRLTGDRAALRPRPSRATTIEQGYGNIARFFPGGRALTAALDDELVERVVGPQPPDASATFEDQYCCTGGQLYELCMGHDRWAADLRPLLRRRLAAEGRALGHCCHPYDLCTELIARTAGVHVTDPAGRPQRAPLDVCHAVGWIGYANAAIRSQVEPALQALLRAHGLAPES
jgi:hypothetical protein